MPVHVDVEDYHRLYRLSRTAGPEIRRAFRKHLRDAAKIGADAAKRRALTISRTGGTLGSNRRRGTNRARALGVILAGNIRVSVRGDDIRITQGSAGIGGRNAKGLPRGLDEFTGFTHPVFGHRPEVQQAGRPYFQRSMVEKRPEMEREVAQVLDDLERHLT